MADPEMDALNDPDTMNTASTDNDLQDAQLDDSLAPEHYEASDLKVLEGLEACLLYTSDAADELLTV